MFNSHYPEEERYSLTDHARRSSRSVCANIAEAFFKRICPAAFLNRLSDALSETAETMVWLKFSAACGYVDLGTVEELTSHYELVVGKLITMMQHPQH